MGSVIDALKRKRALTPKKARAPPKPADRELPKGTTLRRLKMKRKPLDPPEYFTIGKERKEVLPGTSPIAATLPRPATKKAAARALEDAERCYAEAERHLVGLAIDPHASLEKYLEARLRLRRMSDCVTEARSNLRQFKKGK